MRRTAVVLAMLAALPLSGLPGAATAFAQEARPDLSINTALLPPLLVVQPKSERDRQSLVAAGAGAIVGIVAVDVVTGGLLLAPLGLPSFSSLFGGGGAAVAVPAPTYTVVQQITAGLSTMVAALGGGYVGMLVAGPVPTQ
jgi:hypothetical protein